MKRQNQPVEPAPKPTPRLHGSARDCWDVGSVFQVVTVPAVRLSTKPSMPAFGPFTARTGAAIPYVELTGSQFNEMGATVKEMLPDEAGGQ